ncbi:MAG TPA: IS21 family transposase [Streptosporangiaceae bacterium]|nr:IS21 family transposase [Streptosporangiaceae bacterium]
MTDVREVLRRLRVGEPARRIARELGLSRNTVAGYHRWARQHGLLAGELPDAASLATLLRPPESAQPRPEQSGVAPFRAQVVAWRQQGVEGQAIFQLLVEQHGFTGSYSAVKRFLRRLEPPTPRATVRVETAPGEEAQVDFGPAGLLFDSDGDRLRRAWAFVMTLSFSRHQYVEFVFDQTVATWCRCHRAAFEWFQGVPRRVVLDNLKAAIVRAVLYDPQVQRVYRELAEHYGFLIAPCRPQTPEHKGKVEQGGVHYVSRNCLAGRAFRDVHHANEHALRWCVETAGRRCHGTIKQQPLVLFETVERPALLPLPATPWVPVTWKQAKLHPDCHVVFNGAYYSAPHRLIGQRLWVRAAATQVQLFHDYALVATHLAARPGQRRTLHDHLPPDKVHFLLQTPRWCQEQAATIGPTCATFIAALLGERPLDRLRGAQGVLRLAQRYGPTRLEAACARASAVGEYRYTTVKLILAAGLDRQPLGGLEPASAAGPVPVPRHARPWTDFFPDPGAEGGPPWN